MNESHKNSKNVRRVGKLIESIRRNTDKLRELLQTRSVSDPEVNALKIRLTRLKEAYAARCKRRYSKHEKLIESIGTKSIDMTEFYARHGIVVQDAATVHLNTGA